MNRTWYSIGLVLSPLLVLVIIHALFFAQAQSHETKQLHIVCTTSMIGDLVTQIVGDNARITILMGPGIDPHGYRAKESDVRALMSADLVFYNGLHLEGKMIELLQSLPKQSAIAVADAIPRERLIATEYQDLYDPHIWHDVSLWVLVADYVAPLIAQIMPDQQELILQRAAQYTNQLRALHASVHQAMNRIPPTRRVLVTAHDAFSYFGKTYGLSVVGLQGINTDVEISIQDITQLVDTMIQTDNHALFLETSVSPRSMHALSQAAHARNWPLIIGPELFSDALGDEAVGGQTYKDMIEHNCHAIVTTLLQAATTLSSRSI